MSLSETTRSVLRLVEERSGIPVHVEPDPNLPGTILAKVVMARENLLLHRVFYRPNSTTPPDYLICQQAGFILRFFAVPADRRFDFAASDAGTKAVEELVKVHPVAKMLPPQALPQLTTRVLRLPMIAMLPSVTAMRRHREKNRAVDPVAVTADRGALGFLSNSPGHSCSAARKLLK